MNSGIITLVFYWLISHLIQYIVHLTKFKNTFVKNTVSAINKYSNIIKCGLLIEKCE